MASMLGAIVVVAALAGPAREPQKPRSPADRPATYAAFTLNLVRFVTWPERAFAGPRAPFVIGTFASDPVAAALDDVVRGEQLNERPVRSIRIQSLDDLAKCHVVFVSRSTGRQAAVLERAARKPVLTIGDGADFLERGGHVRFVAGPGRTALRISVVNLKASGLECRAQLLHMAAP